jgi:hypothetical protein
MITFRNSPSLSLSAASYVRGVHAFFDVTVPAGASQCTGSPFALTTESGIWLACALVVVVACFLAAAWLYKPLQNTGTGKKHARPFFSYFVVMCDMRTRPWASAAVLISSHQVLALMTLVLFDRPSKASTAMVQRQTYALLLEIASFCAAIFLDFAPRTHPTRWFARGDKNFWTVMAIIGK